jgi:hypothetical protein
MNITKKKYDLFKEHLNVELILSSLLDILQQLEKTMRGRGNIFFSSWMYHSLLRCPSLS